MKAFLRKIYLSNWWHVPLLVITMIVIPARVVISYREEIKTRTETELKQNECQDLLVQQGTDNPEEYIIKDLLQCETHLSAVHIQLVECWEERDRLKE